MLLWPGGNSLFRLLDAFLDLHIETASATDFVSGETFFTIGAAGTLADLQKLASSECLFVAVRPRSGRRPPLYPSCPDPRPDLDLS